METDAYHSLRTIVVCNMTFSVEHGDFVLHDYGSRVVLATMIIVEFLLGIVGNLLVILAVVLSKKLRTTTNVFVINLAVADFVTSLFLPVHATTLLSKNSCYIPDLLCKFVAAVTLTTIGCSVVTLAMIAFSRFHILYGVLKPKPIFSNIYTTRNIAAMVAFSWLYPIFLMCVIIPVGVGSLGYSLQYKVCTQDTENKNSNYMSLTAGLLVQFPAFVVIIVCYVLIIVTIRRHQRDMQSIYVISEKSKPYECEVNVTVVEDDVDGDRKNRARQPIKEVRSSNCSSAGQVVNGPSDSTDSRMQSHEAVIEQSPISLTKLNEEDDAEAASSSSSSTKAPAQATSSWSPSRSITSTGTLSRERRDAMYRQQITITINLFIVVCVYTICVMPAAVAVLVPDRADPAIPWLTILLLCNSCVNPIIYGLKHPTFGRVFICIIKCRFADIPEPARFLRRHTRTVER